MQIERLPVHARLRAVQIQQQTRYGHGQPRQGCKRPVHLPGLSFTRAGPGAQTVSNEYQGKQQRGQNMQGYPVDRGPFLRPLAVLRELENRQLRSQQHAQQGNQRAAGRARTGEGQRKQRQRQQWPEQVPAIALHEIGEVIIPQLKPGKAHLAQ